MKSGAERLLAKHHELIHSDMQKVVSHVQRPADEWILNTLMIEGYDVPFQYKRKQKYKNLRGARVNLTYYASTRDVAGMQLEVMNVVRIKRS
jgi:hypothetical protein